MTRPSLRAFGLLLLLVVLLPAGACSRRDGDAPAPIARLEPAQLGTIARVHEMDGIYLAGQPTPGDFEDAKKAGIKTVITLRHDKEIEFDESTVVTSLGMDFVRLPWSGPEELTDAVFDRGRELLASAPRPLMMHCNSANRVGPIWIAYRVLDGGVAFDDALREAKTIGLKTAEFADQAREYIERKTAAR
jgi:uncharacterized protein (TIGR01244 family)